MSVLPASPLIVLSSGLRYSIHFCRARRKSWLTKKHARTRCVRVRSRQTVSIAAHHARELVTHSSLIVIAATKRAREISEKRDFRPRKGARGTSGFQVSADPFELLVLFRGLVDAIIADAWRSPRSDARPSPDPARVVSVVAPVPASPRPAPYN